MRLILERFSSGKEDTVGRLMLDGKQLCYTLEDQHRDVKVKGDTRIPEGTYEIKLRKEGGHHSRYAVHPHYRDIHKGMLHLQDVPNFQYILIHVGNTDEDTAGCILVGSAANVTKREKQSISGSVAAYRKVYPVIAEALERGERVYIQIKTVG